jgi:hypothetical protein
MNPTSEDPILADLYVFRKQHAEAFNYDVSAMMEELIREQEELEKQGRRYASYPARRCQQDFPYMTISESSHGAGPSVGSSAAPTDTPTAAE